MAWTKPDFVEIPLGMEVTAYVNTDGPASSCRLPVVKEEKLDVSSPATDD